MDDSFTQKAKQMAEVCQKYSDQLLVLNKKQNEIISKLILQLETVKINEIRKSIGLNQ